MYFYAFVFAKKGFKRAGTVMAGAHVQKWVSENKIHKTTHLPCVITIYVSNIFKHVFKIYCHK